jgi:tRNA pseudouridine32 synthase/23S rRNA pseudouridine746 synthase
MFFAKEPEVAKELMAAFRARKVSKYYVALSSRRPSKKEGSVKGDMRRGRRGGWMLERTQDNPAVTRFASAGVPAAAAPGLRAFLLKPDTGKTHQLRVALKSLGSPVLGDQRYANKGEAEGEERAYLHCAALRVVLGGKAVQVVSPPLEGAHFLGEGFRGVFDAWFPPEMRGDEGVWFGDSKLLRSRLDVAVPVGFGSLSQGSMF